MERIFQQTIHIPGTLAADVNYRFKAPCGCTLLHVSAVSSNSAAAGLEIGTGSDADAYMAKKAIGASNNPSEFQRSDFIGAQFPRIADGSVVALALDYDYNGGGAGSASANVTVVLTLAEG